MVTSDKCPSPSSFCVTRPSWLFQCQFFIGRRAGRDMEILSSVLCCPKMESTCSKICFGAAQHRMNSAAVTSTVCPPPTRPCWTPPLQCRALLLIETAAPSSLCPVQPFWEYCNARAQFICSSRSAVTLSGLCCDPSSKPVTHTHK